MSAADSQLNLCAGSMADATRDAGSARAEAAADPEASQPSLSASEIAPTWVGLNVPATVALFPICRPLRWGRCSRGPRPWALSGEVSP